VSVSRRAVRLALLALVAVAALSLAVSYVGADEPTTTTASEQADVPFEDREPIAPPRENVTVMTGQGFGDRPPDAITAFAPDGRLLYYNDTHDEYHDVDPASGGAETVMYVAADHVAAERCGATTRCTVSVVERVNLTTGETDRIHRSIAPSRVGDNTHDVDRIGKHELLIADIAYDRVLVRNTSTGQIKWEWEAQSDYPIEGGGPYPEDWTHLNDVEELPSGEIMASLRNQDQVVFLTRTTGIREERTLGAEGDHETLFEQHNPDYIPASRGGPAVIVADSENDRIVEYERANGSWQRTWWWADARLDWPRDADRLPNGNTLVVDTSGGRVLEVNATGDVAWSIETKGIYDAERLGTGDESAGGKSAASLGLPDRVPANDARSLTGRIVGATLTTKIASAIAFILPHWATLTDAIVAILLVLALLVWVCLELWWRRDAITLQRPIKLE
jgi:hypothetical protein